MHAASLLATTIETVPTDDAGAPAWLVGLVFLGLSLGVGWWFFKISTARVTGEMVERKKRSKKYRRLTEVDQVSTTLASAAALDDGFGSIPEVHVSAVPPVTEDGVTVQDRLAELDRALTTGKISADEHRILRAALLEGFPGGWIRPGPVAPPTE